MNKRILAVFIGLATILTWSCNHNGNKKDLQDAENRIIQQEDGSILLSIDKAACYSDKVNPSSNTAEWDIVISKAGRFKVWLSSATKDTTFLNYANSVRIYLLDNQLEVKPVCDKVVHSSDVPYPYFRADSYMGSFYISEPGEYNIQVISEKVIAKNTGLQNTSLIDSTRLMSVILTPGTR